MPQATSSVRAGGSAASARAERLDLLLPARPLALGEAAGAAVPLVVLAARAGRSTPSRFLDYAPCRGPSSPSRTSPRGATGRRSTRSPRRCARAARGCSTSTPTRITTARSSRSSAPATSSSSRCSPAIARAAELIDLRRHEGAHPRIGAADVVPLVPLAAGGRGARARGGGRAGARGSGEELGAAGLPLRRARRRARAGVLPRGRAGGAAAAGRRGRARPGRTGRRGCRSRPAACSSACGGR